MKEYNAENHAKNLPDIYKKSTDSNNYKILEIERSMERKLRADLKEIENILTLDNARGKTLDLYGERIGQKRGSATDQQYLIMLKSKIAQRTSNGSFNDVVNAACYAFGCKPSEIIIEESDLPCTIKKISIPLQFLNRAGLSSKQAHRIVSAVLPIGIKLEEYLLEGTFCFCENEGEYDESAGFALIEGAGEEDIGGYLGAAESDDNEAVLPL